MGRSYAIYGVSMSKRQDLILHLETKTLVEVFQFCVVFGVARSFSCHRLALATRPSSPSKSRGRGAQKVRHVSGCRRLIDEVSDTVAPNGVYGGT